VVMCMHRYAAHVSKSRGRSRRTSIDEFFEFDSETSDHPQASFSDNDIDLMRTAHAHDEYVPSQDLELSQTTSITTLPLSPQSPSQAGGHAHVLHSTSPHGHGHVTADINIDRDTMTSSSTAQVPLTQLSGSV
jgi:hypothetical protein